MMRLQILKSGAPQRGFSLVELAIVVAVTGLLFGGLWRLMASGNAQLREQTAADQMTQIVNATRNFLASQAGQAFIQGLGPNITAQLGLPATLADAAGSGTCAGALLPAGTGTYCNFLPLGFWTGVTNSYGQSYQVYVRKDNTPLNQVAQTYDFVVLTTGGDVIPETSGSRIAANIGANGGFVFSNNTCGAPAQNFACGSYNSFNLNLTAAGPYGAITPGFGHIVTQNSSTLSNAANAQWLARVTIAGDTATPPVFNTMTVPLHMQAGGAAAINMRGNFINMNAGTGGPGGGTISLEQGTLSGPGTISINNPDGTVPLTVDTSLFVTPPGAVAAQVNGLNCDIYADPINCQPALAVSGSAQISRSLSVLDSGTFVNTLEAGTFIYSSDIRLKRDLVPLAGSLDKISKLKGYTFHWRNSGREDVGLVAQEVQDVFPELVHASRNDKLGVQYGNLVAPMIEAIKELRLQNLAMQQRLDAQEKELQSLRSKH